MFEVLPAQDNLDNDLKLNVYMSVYKYKYMYLYIFVCIFYVHIHVFKIFSLYFNHIIISYYPTKLN